MYRETDHWLWWLIEGVTHSACVRSLRDDPSVTTMVVNMECMGCAGKWAAMFRGGGGGTSKLPRRKVPPPPSKLGQPGHRPIAKVGANNAGRENLMLTLWQWYPRYTGYCKSSTELYKLGKLICRDCDMLCWCSMLSNQTGPVRIKI